MSTSLSFFMFDLLLKNTITYPHCPSPTKPLLRLWLCHRQSSLSSSHFGCISRREEPEDKFQTWTLVNLPSFSLFTIIHWPSYTELDIEQTSRAITRRSLDLENGTQCPPYHITLPQPALVRKDCVPLAYTLCLNLVSEVCSNTPSVSEDLANLETRNTIFISIVTPDTRQTSTYFQYHKSIIPTRGLDHLHESTWWEVCYK